MSYLRDTKELTLTLEGEAPLKLKWWADESHGVHEDSRGHTGGIMTLVKGVVIWKSNKKKINTNISTESEIVGVHDVLSEILWSKYFLKEQGINSENNVIYQDNKNSLLL